MGRVFICSFCLIIIFGIEFQLSNVDFGSTKIGWDFWRLSVGLNDRYRFSVIWDWKVFNFEWASTWIGRFDKEFDRCGGVFYKRQKKKSFELVREIQVNTFDDDSRHVSIFDRVSTWINLFFCTDKLFRFSVILLFHVLTFVWAWTWIGLWTGF